MKSFVFPSTPSTPGECTGSPVARAPQARAFWAFTLIELLVVIAVISILAAMLFPVGNAVNRAKIRQRVRSEMTQVQTAIESYKSKLGFYPPSDTNSPAPNSLYYELLGTFPTNNTTAYVSLDGSSRIAANVLPTIFGPSIGGFLNCTRGAGGDERQPAAKFFPGLKQGQFLAVTPTNAAAPIFTLLGANIPGPVLFPSPEGGKINPWRYNSAAPVHNSNNYDLWIDVLIGNKVYRICNWSTEPLQVSSPYLE